MSNPSNNWSSIKLTCETNGRIESSHIDSFMKKLKPIIDKLEEVFENDVWVTVERVYETRHDCCTAGA